MMVVFQLLLALSVLLSLWFAIDMWPPWRSHDRQMSWLLFVWATAAAALESVFLAATLHVRVPPLLALAVFLVHDGVMIWRMVVARRSRHPS